MLARGRAVRPFPVIVWPLVVAAAILSVERVSYVWIARHAREFSGVCARPGVRWLGEPVAVVRKLFYGFKAVQLSVFAAWCYFVGGSLALAHLDPMAVAIGAALLLAGQILNVSVFYRLGMAGVFYGDRLGHDIPWCRAFPFSLLSHPQYVGAVLSIWGLFLALRYPHPDWVAIPALETIYYVASTLLEERAPDSRLARAGKGPRRRIGGRATARLRAALRAASARRGRLRPSGVECRASPRGQMSRDTLTGRGSGSRRCTTRRASGCRSSRSPGR